MQTLRCRERSADRVTGILYDSTPAVVAGSDVTICTLTLWDLETAENTSPVEGIINARHAFDVLGSSEVTISEAGEFVWYMDPADNVIVNSRRQVERHRATLHFEWQTTTEDGFTNVELEIEVENLRRIT